MTKLVVGYLVLNGQLKLGHQPVLHEYLEQKVGGAVLEPILDFYQLKPLILAYSVFKYFAAIVDICNIGEVALAPQ